MSNRLRNRDANRRSPARLAVIFAVTLLAPALTAQEPAAKLAKRYGHDYTPSLYPQSNPGEALQSIVKALEAGRVDYLLAHLADPKFVDPRIAEYKALYTGGDEGRALVAFERLVRETTLHFREDPALLKELRRFAKDAEWETKEAEAAGALKQGSPRRVYLRKLEDRWFLENRQQ
jgi:hypothetical protein